MIVIVTNVRFSQNNNMAPGRIKLVIMLMRRNFLLFIPLNAFSIYFLTVINLPSEYATLTPSLCSRKSENVGTRYTWVMSSIALVSYRT